MLWQITHTIQLRWWLVFLSLCMLGKLNAQTTVTVGETTTLSVGVVPESTYAWDLYVPTSGIDFANENGNCPITMARFVGGNTGNSVQVQWLIPGTYYYKVQVDNGCSKNLKIGEVIVQSATIAPPKVRINYDCFNGTALLEAYDYSGELLWNNGETSSSITINTQTIPQGSLQTYSVLQIVNGIRSAIAEVQIQNASQPNAPDTSQVPTTIYLGESVQLSTVSCESGAVHWFSDAELTHEITDDEIIPTETTTYYAVCKTNVGCESESAVILLKVIAQNSCEDSFNQMNIPNAISPNGDGYNDVWNIEDLKEYCLQCNKQAKLSIFNRWGVKIYEKEDYMLTNDRFEGKSQHYRTVSDEKLPQGTYFYVLTFNDGKNKTGYLYVGHDK